MPAIPPDRLICPMLHGFNRSLNRVKNQNPSHAPAPGQACMGRWLSSLMTHTACSPGVGSRCWPKLSAGRSEGSSPSDAKDRALHTCIRQVRVDLDHDAVMRIGGKAPRRQAHSLRWRTSHACLGSPPPRIVIGAAVRATRRRNRLLAICFPAGCSRRCTQDDTPRDLAGRHQLPQCNQQLARQRDHHGLAGGAAGIGCPRPIPLGQGGVSGNLCKRSRASLF